MSGRIAPGHACGDRDAKQVLMSLAWLHAPGNGRKPGRTYAQDLAPTANDLAPAFVLSLAAGLRLRGAPMRRSRCSPTSASGGGGAVPCGHKACGVGKARRPRWHNARASSGHHDMGASVAPVPTVRPPRAQGLQRRTTFLTLLSSSPGQRRRPPCPRPADDDAGCCISRSIVEE